MQEFIAKRWWPYVKAAQISPIAWRMFDRGELRKEGDVYMLPDEAGTAPLPSVSAEELRELQEREIVSLHTKANGEA